MILHDKAVIVTGASRGIGAAVVRAVAAKGAPVGLIARSRDELDQLLAEVGGRGAVATADVADPAALARAIDAIEAELGPTDVLVANAGIGAYGRFAEIEADELERVVKVNVLGTLCAIRAVLPGMMDRRSGHIVVLGSIAGRIGSPFEAVYSASKFAGVGLAEALVVEAEPFGVGVSIVNPGPVATDFGEARGHPYDRRWPKPLKPETVAAAVVGAIEGNRREVYVGRWFRAAVIMRHLLPPAYWSGAKRSFGDELRT
jgi:short-subunit dehydrogenase